MKPMSKEDLWPGSKSVQTLYFERYIRITAYVANAIGMPCMIAVHMATGSSLLAVAWAVAFVVALYVLLVTQ